MNRNVIVVLCIVVGITVLLLVGKRGSRPPQPNAAVSGGQVADTSALAPGAGDPPRGSVAPDFSLKSLPDGKSIELSSLRGKAVLVNFWATYCGPCKIEMPWLDELQKKYGSQGLEILGVAMDDSDEKPIIDFAHKMGVSYPILKGNNKVGDLYGGVDRLPISYFVDRDGKITHEIIGLVSESDIENAVKEALASGKKEALASSK
ncbi:MAG TPA: TlpA disulfide reductase family protein [Candidatus Angelobacter sp.]|nr:TlpA disulfide reductase family protein [Candidatus Angelobacter sp.]